jgi:hypothetical protein
MSSAKHHLFRPEAIQRYIKSKEKAVLPRFVSPNTHTFLWFLLGLLMASILFTWLVEIPVFASGAAVIVSRSTLTQTTSDSAWFVVFLPADILPHLRFGQNLFMQMGNKRTATTIIDIEEETISPEVARNRFNLGFTEHSVFTKPVAVAYAPSVIAPGNLSPNLYQGSIFEVDIEIGARRVITLLPVIGRFFGK